MNALLPFQTTSMPPLSLGESYFECRIQGVQLDCVIHDCEEGIHVCAVWHAGVSIDEIIKDDVLSMIESAYLEHVEQVNTDFAIERRYG